MCQEEEQQQKDGEKVTMDSAVVMINTTIVVTSININIIIISIISIFIIITIIILVLSLSILCKCSYIYTLQDFDGGICETGVYLLVLRARPHATHSLAHTYTWQPRPHLGEAPPRETAR